MRSRLRDTALPAMLMLTTALGGCDKLTPNGQSSTMTLLRSGSEKTCTASDVQDALRKLILPSSTGGGDPDRSAAIASVTLSYAFTTLSAFDKAVSKASCSTTVTVSGPNNASSKFDIVYDISPSADNPATFVLSTHSSEAKAYADDLIDTAAAQAAAQRTSNEQEAQRQQVRAKLLAVVNPRWLTGTWIAVGADPSNCADNRALTIAANHSFASQGRSGQWSLDADQLHFVGSGPTGAVDDTNTITQADAVSFTSASADNSVSNWRRCARAEITPPTPPLPDTILPVGTPPN